ncbi:MAG TPA: SPOR domain-containing protein [Longimicrobiales bacterium]|nr:SPOR domain-containing protein [Longimicrobiales bacterium]
MADQAHGPAPPSIRPATVSFEMAVVGRDLSTARAFMTADLPDWIPAEPGTLPALPAGEGRQGRILVLLSTEGALSAGWVGSVSVDVVESWSQSGARVVMADAGLSTPLLHEALGIQNREGLVDALRWGVSVQRVVQRPEGRTFLAMTAGTAVADTAAVLALPRWHALCAGFREAGVTLAVLVPSWEEALPSVLAEADGIVVLAEASEDVTALVAPLSVPVLAVTGRNGDTGSDERPEEPSETVDSASTAVTASDFGYSLAPTLLAPPQDGGEEGDEPGPPGHDAEPPAVETAAWDAEPGTPPFPQEPAEEEFVLPDPVPVPPSLEEIVEESRAPAQRGRSGILFLVVLVVVVAVALAAWFGFVEIPGLTPSSGTASAVPPEAVVVPAGAVVVAAAPPTETSGVQGYSLALGAYQNAAVAGRRVATLAAQVPQVLFQAVPVEVEGTLYHRVLAGPAADSTTLAALTSHVAEAASLNPSPWVARWTPLAFQLGETGDRGAADRRVEALGQLGVSAYVLAVDYSDGSVRYRVFAGAFADAAEASYLSGLLDERGLSGALLSDRIGRLPE